MFDQLNSGDEVCIVDHSEQPIQGKFVRTRTVEVVEIDVESETGIETVLIPVDQIKEIRTTTFA